ncbi:MAG: radical SAM protein [Clostridia bacterium]|nr:radical SAM protein [Clostridia bacterium]
MKCLICPRKCGADRTNCVGFCGTGEKVKIALYKLFEYEEPCISVGKGSGAIFFSGCSLKCVYCQNYDISTLANGRELSIQRLADIFKELEDMGAENINLVNPTHYVVQIAKAFKIYKPKIPIVYNTHGYESEQSLAIACKFVDVFLTDFKYFDNAVAKKYSKAEDYVEVCKKALDAMKQHNPTDEFCGEKLVRGVIVRHLVLPLCASDSVKILTYIKQKYPNTIVSLMAQYTPYGEVDKFPELNRKITKREYDKVVDAFVNLGLDGYVQERESSSCEYIPKWDY